MKRKHYTLKDKEKSKSRRIFTLIVFLAMAISILVMSKQKSTAVYAKQIVEVEVISKEWQRPPVMARVADCESGDMHFKDGKVVRGRKNSDDIGRYQINLDAHAEQLFLMGLNPFNEEDNEIFARYLFENYGTSPWYLSKHCWLK